MEVFKRPGSPSWYVDMVHPRTGERIRQSLKFKGSKVEAQRKARQLEAELETKPTKDEVTLGQAIDRYVEALTKKGKVSAKNHAYRRDRLFADLSEVIHRDMPLAELTPAKMEAVVLSRTAAGKQPQTIKHDINLIRASVRYAVALGAEPPAALERSGNANPWRVPKVGIKTRYLSPKEFELVRAYLDPERGHLPDHLRNARRDTYDLLHALAYTGARWGEVAGLTWDRVDLAEGTIRLYAGKVERERVVPIAQPLGAVLRRRLSERGAGSPFVFPGPGGRQRRQPANGIGQAMDATGLNEPETVAKYGRATIHSLRHTFASWLIQNGADLGEVADALGHANMNMTKRYAHLSKGKTLAKLGGILNAIKPSTAGHIEAEGTGLGGSNTRSTEEAGG